MTKQDESKPLVTIGLPVYNGELFLKHALDSLLSQTYENFELIISNNFSTDNTNLICQDYQKKDKRIRYFQQTKNIGTYQNCLFVLKQSNTTFFQWAAADDLWHDTFLEKNIQFLEKNPNFIGSISQVDYYDDLCIDWMKIITKSFKKNHLKYIMVKSITGTTSKRVKTIKTGLKFLCSL